MSLQIFNTMTSLYTRTAVKRIMYPLRCSFITFFSIEENNVPIGSPVLGYLSDEMRSILLLGKGLYLCAFGG